MAHQNEPKAGRAECAKSLFVSGLPEIGQRRIFRIGRKATRSNKNWHTLLGTGRLLRR